MADDEVPDALKEIPDDVKSGLLAATGAEQLTQDVAEKYLGVDHQQGEEAIASDTTDVPAFETEGSA